MARGGPVRSAAFERREAGREAGDERCRFHCEIASRDGGKMKENKARRREDH